MATTVSEITEGAYDRPVGLPVSTLVIARRAILRFLRTPQLVVLGTMQGVLFLLIGLVELRARLAFLRREAESAPPPPGRAAEVLGGGIR